ncbi:MAG: TldD/PmbA family protein [Bacteroidales bacterium]|nr:TldD/PmbA family protein [Bacteroidales bacterium]
MIKTKAAYLNLFGVTEEILERLVAEGISRGGDYSDLFFENTSFINLLLRDGEVASGGRHVDYGVGIRVLKGDKTGYAYSETTELSDMLSAARAASAIAEGSASSFPYEGCRARKYFPGEPNPAADRYPLLSESTEGLVRFMKAIEKGIFACEQRTVKVMVSLSFEKDDVLLYNSCRELKYDTRPMATVAITAIFAQDGKMENNTFSRSRRMGTEMFSDALIEEAIAGTVRGLDERFDAKRPKGGKMSVVMGAGASGILLHEAMGHAFEADFARKGQSIFTGRLGQKVCPSGITIVDDGTLKGNRGSLNFDDEGVPGQRTCMVEDGVLTSFLHDRISARHFGVAPTGNGRRESFRHIPIPRMRSTYMESGDADPKSLVAEVKKGIFVDTFSNGQVKIGEGDFTFYVKSGFLIEDGRLTAPIKDVNIIGNGPETLSEIVGVGNDLIIDEGAWTCGKEQLAPVTCGIPTVLIKSLTVGGE